MLVDNEPGILARVIGLFSGRGYNIDSLTVSETEHEKHLSRITIVTIGHAEGDRADQAQLERLVPVHRVVDLTDEGKRSSASWRWSRCAARASSGSRRCGWPTPSGRASSTRDRELRLRGDRRERQDRQFIALMMPLGLVEVVRTGLAAISRGPEAM